jgi:hypothetical protein
MTLIILGLALDTLLSFLTNNLISNTSLVATERAPVPEVHGVASFQLAVVSVRDLPSPCPSPSRTTFSTPSTAWTVSSIPSSSLAPSECGYLIACPSCRLSTTSTISGTLPYDFQIGSWAVASTSAHLPTEPTPSPTIVTGTWGNGSVTTLVTAVDTLLIGTAEVRIHSPAVAYGYLFSLESTTESPSTILPETPFLPSSTPVRLSFVLKPSPNALVTELSPRLTVIEAISLLVGAIGGATSLFAFLNRGCEHLSRLLTSLTRDSRFNFAETDMDGTLEKKAGSQVALVPHMPSMSPRITMVNVLNPMEVERTPSIALSDVGGSRRRVAERT